MDGKVVFGGGALFVAAVAVAIFGGRKGHRAGGGDAGGACGATTRARAGLELPLRLEGYVSRIDAKEARVADEVTAIVGAAHVHDIGVPRSWTDWNERRSMPRAPDDVTDGLRSIVVGYGDRELLVPILRVDPDPGAAALDLLVAARVEALHRAALRRSWRFGVAGGSELRERIQASSPESPLDRASVLFGGAASFVPVDLHAPVDPALDGLFVTAPRVDFTDAELAEVDRYVDAGRPAVILASAAYENAPPSLEATRGLDRLLRKRGVEVRVDELISGKPTTFPPWILRLAPRPYDDPASPLFYGIDAIHVGSASSLEVHAPNAQVLLRAGRDVLRRDPTGAPHPVPQDGTDGPPVAVLVGRVLVISAHHALSDAFGTVMREDPSADVERYAHAMDPSTYGFLRNVFEWMTIPEENWRACAPARHDPVHE